MPDSTKMTEALQDWWAFIVFLLGSAASFHLGTKRSQWQLQQALQDIEELDQRLKQAEKLMGDEAIAMAEVTSTLKAVAENQNRILDAIGSLQSGKVDK